MKKLITGLWAILFLVVAGCSPQVVETVTPEPEEEPPAVQETEPEYRIIYLEIGTDTQSTHFEHRVANIYSIGIDGSNRELIFSDIDYFWDLGRVYSVSPDGRWLVCSFFEGGRGAYRSLSLIDTETGDLEQIVEFDYTQDGIEGEQKQVYGQPVWSQDGSMLAYEVINIPPEPRVESYNTDWIQVYNLNSKEVKQVIPRIGGMCATKLTFMQPVLFLPDGRLAVVYHGFYSSAQDETDIYSVNEEVYLMDLESADITQIMDVDYFDQIEQVQSFSNFRLWENSIVFEILGDFEEDGDIYRYMLQEKNIEQVTSDSQLREQQPDAAEGKLCYVGVPRYGTLAYGMPSGDIYVLEGQQPKKITEFDLGAAKPIFSPHGEQIAYLKYNYDSNYEFVENTDIQIHDLQSRQTTSLVSSEQIIDLVGWMLED